MRKTRNKEKLLMGRDNRGDCQERRQWREREESKGGIDGDGRRLDSGC